MADETSALNSKVLKKRRKWFEDYCNRLELASTHSGKQECLYPCPCCGCNTLEERGNFEICSVCFWEDDGQDDEDADTIRNGPNGSLSLTQAHQNYLCFGTSDKRVLPSG